MMDLIECLETRISTRDFKSDPVDESVIVEALQAANLAPSAGNLQARDFIVVRDVATKRALMEAALKQDFVRTAPAVIVCCANLERIGHYGTRGRQLYCIQDSAAAIENMLLFLTSKGIGSVWVGSFDEEKVWKLLGLPKEIRPVALVPIGYPAEKGTRRRRLPVEKITHWEKW